MDEGDKTACLSNTNTLQKCKKFRFHLPLILTRSAFIRVPFALLRLYDHSYQSMTSQ